MALIHLMIHSSMAPSLESLLVGVGMEDPTDQFDRESDYGSDFTPDEELLLGQLLQKFPSTSTPENDENIRHAAISHTTGQGLGDKGSPKSWKVAARKTSISLEGYGSTYTYRRWRILWGHATN